MARAPVPERTFPRGGRKAKKWVSADADFSLFKSKKNKAIKKKHSKKSHTKKPKKDDGGSKVVDSINIQDLLPANVRSGMAVLGCVDKITELNVQLSLPGNIRVIISAVNISASYSDRIQKEDNKLPTLSEIFEINEQYPVKILEKFEDSPSKFQATLDPREINSKISARFLQKGMTLTASIASEEDYGYILDIGIPKVTTFLHKKDAAEDEIYHVGQLINIFVKKVSPDRHTLRVIALKKMKEITDIDSELPISCFVPGMQWKLMVTKAHKNGVEVALRGFGPNIRGFIYINQLTEIFPKLSDYPEATELEGTLLYVMPVLNLPFFIANNQEKPSWSVPFGTIVENVKVMRVSNRGLIGKIETKSTPEKCFIPVARMNEHSKVVEAEIKLKDVYPVGVQLPFVRIEQHSRLNRMYFGAIDRESLKRQIYSKTDLKVGQVVKCRLSVIGKKYCTVELSKHVKGFVAASHMLDSPRMNFNTKFKAGQLVKARVLALGEPHEMVRLTLKPSLVKADPILSEETKVKPGESYIGTVCRVQPSKIFIEFFGGRVGNMSRRNLNVPKGTTLYKMYSVGQIVKCFVMSSRKGKLTLTVTRPLAAMKEKKSVASITSKVVNVDVCAKKQPCPDVPDVNVAAIQSDSSDCEMEVKAEPAALMDVGFDWSVAENPQLLMKGSLSHNFEEETSSDEEELESSEKKKRKRLTGVEKKEKARELELRLRSREQELVDPARPPQSADDFDRLVVSTPDDSALWLRYMAFHLENTEIEKARSVARRALKVISFREEQEKLNVWFALLNLEQLYGSTESQKDVLEEALRCNDPYKVHIHKLNVLVDAGMGLEAEHLANTMLRKYGETESVWWKVGEALMKMGKLDFARSVLQRGITILPNAKHVALITRFAQLENKFGSSERAQTLYEHVLSAFPKRVDVWSAYVDLMVKSERIDLARQILERATSQSLPPKKMKILVKKFISFEEACGTPQNIEDVKNSNYY